MQLWETKWPANGSGPAQSITPDPPPIKLAQVVLNVARVGNVEPMVYSGAMVSVVRKDIVEGILKEELKAGGFVVEFDRVRVPVVGEMPLSV